MTMTMRKFIAPLALALAAASPAVSESAQNAFELKDPASAPVSRWQNELDAIDAQVRLMLLTANDPWSHYVAGRLDNLDLASAVGHFTAARVAAPQEQLYLATLAAACLQPVQPTLPECDAVDRLADWARRDVDNGLPQLWLAERARKRNDGEAVVAYVEQAAGSPRFDDYGARGMLEMWEYFKSAQLGADPAAKATAALGYGATQPSGWTGPAYATCLSSAERSEALRSACAKLGTTLAARASSMLARRSGTSILERNTSDAAARARAQSRQAELIAEGGRCGDLVPRAQLESADASTRARAVSDIEVWVRTLAQYGEVAGCERLMARNAAAK